MAEAAPRRMTIEEFLAWDDGAGRRGELVRGPAIELLGVALPFDAIYDQSGV